MKLLKVFCSWFRRTYFPNEFDRGYEWAKQEIWWGDTPGAIIMQCNCDGAFRTDFDRGAEQAARDHLEKNKF